MLVLIRGSQRLKPLVIDISTLVNSLYCGLCIDLEEVSSLQRVRNSGSLFQSNVCDLFSGGFSCCPFYRGVRKARVDCNTLLDRSLQLQISWGPPRPHLILRIMHVEYAGNKISTRLGILRRANKVLPKSTCLLV